MFERVTNSGSSGPTKARRIYSFLVGWGRRRDTVRAERKDREERGRGRIFERSGCGSRQKRLGSIAARLGTAGDQRRLLKVASIRACRHSRAVEGKYSPGHPTLCTAEKYRRGRPRQTQKTVASTRHCVAWMVRNICSPASRSTTSTDQARTRLRRFATITNDRKYIFRRTRNRGHM